VFPAQRTDAGKEGDMHRITLKTRSLIVSAIVLGTALLVAAFPLVAAADVSPHGP
jgi:hypothetical protein